MSQQLLEEEEETWSQRLKRQLTTKKNSNITCKLHQVEFEDDEECNNLLFASKNTMTAPTTNRRNGNSSPNNDNDKDGGDTSRLLSKQIVEWHCSDNAKHTSDIEPLINFLKQLVNHVDATKLIVFRAMRNRLPYFFPSVTPPSATIATLPSTVGPFVSLKCLNLSKNVISSLPEDFWHTFPHLEELDLSNNELSELIYNEESQNFLKHLKLVNLFNNRLSSISDKFFAHLFPYLCDDQSESSNLRELNLSNNQLTSIPHVFLTPVSKKDITKQSKQCNIRRIDFQMNRFQDMPSISVLENLSELGLHTFDLRFNLIDADRVDLKKVPSHVKQLLIGLEETFPVEIIPNVYVGGKGCARNYPLLKHKNIQYILNAAHKEEDAHFPDMFKKVVVLTALDSEEQDMTQFFDMAHDLINTAIDKDHCGILVHCIAGQSRSISIVISYLMKYRNMSFNDALEYVQSRREVAQPNFAFQIQLMEYEATLPHNKKEQEDQTNGGVDEENSPTPTTPVTPCT